MSSIESGKAPQSSDKVCHRVFDFVFVATIVPCTVQTKSFFTNCTQTHFCAESNEFLAELRQQVQHVQRKLLPTSQCVACYHLSEIQLQQNQIIYWEILIVQYTVQCFDAANWATRTTWFYRWQACKNRLWLPLQVLCWEIWPSMEKLQKRMSLQ